jgi:AraC-like DNA-binding protein
MQRQSFAVWRLPRDLEGVLLLDDRGQSRARFESQERHFHDELELHFVERGRGVFLLPKGRLPVAAGTLVWIPPRRDHLLLEATEDFRRWMLLCRARAVRRVLPKVAHAVLLGRGATERSGLLPQDALVSLRRTFLDVSRDRGGDVSLFNAAVGFALARSWACFERGSSSPEPVALHPAVAAAVSALREPGARPALPELARRAGVTESHLSKLFSSEVGVSITEFRNRLGIERFLETYGDGRDTTLLDAALEAGFGSYPQFHRVFRRHMGYPPAEHRRRATKG